MLSCLRPFSAVLVVLAAIACTDPTSPNYPPGHPGGSNVSKVALKLRPYGLGVTSAGTAVVTRLDTSAVALFDVGKRRFVRSVGVGDIPTSAAASGSVGYVANQGDGTISVIELSTGRETGYIPLPAEPLYVALTARGDRLLVTANDGQLRVFNSSSRALLATIPIGAQPNGVAISGDTIAFVGAAFGGFVKQVDLRTYVAGRTFATSGTPQDVVLSADGATLFAANEGGGVDVFSVASARRLAALAIGASFGAALTPDGTQLYVTQPNAGTVTVLDATTYDVVRTIVVGGDPRRVGFDRRGLTAVVTNQAGFVSFIH